MYLDIRIDTQPASVIDSFINSRRRVELILNPLLRAYSRERIVGRILGLVQPHHLYDQSGFVHPARRIFSAVLIKGDTPILRDPLRGIPILCDGRSLRHASFVDEDKSVANRPVVVSAEQNFAVALQTEGRAG